MRELTTLARRGGQPVGAPSGQGKRQRLDGERAWARLADCEGREPGWRVAFLKCKTAFIDAVFCCSFAGCWATMRYTYNVLRSQPCTSE